MKLANEYYGFFNQTSKHEQQTCRDKKPSQVMMNTHDTQSWDWLKDSITRSFAYANPEYESVDISPGNLNPIFSRMIQVDASFNQIVSAIRGSVGIENDAVIHLDPIVEHAEKWETGFRAAAQSLQSPTK